MVSHVDWLEERAKGLILHVPPLEHGDALVASKMK